MSRINDASLEKRYTFIGGEDNTKYEIWAEGGMIRIENQSDGEYVVLTCEEAKERARSFNQAYKDQQGSEYWRQKQIAEILHNCIRDALTQGDPTDADVTKAKARADRKAMHLEGIRRNPGGAYIFGPGDYAGEQFTSPDDPRHHGVFVPQLPTDKRPVKKVNKRKR